MMRSDVHIDDALGRLSITTDGLYRRDYGVISRIRNAGLPCATVIGGGCGRPSACCCPSWNSDFSGSAYFAENTSLFARKNLDRACLSRLGWHNARLFRYILSRSRTKQPGLSRSSSGLGLRPFTAATGFEPPTGRLLRE